VNEVIVVFLVKKALQVPKVNWELLVLMEYQAHRECMENMVKKVKKVLRDLKDLLDHPAYLIMETWPALYQELKELRANQEKKVLKETKEKKEKPEYPECLECMEHRDHLVKREIRE
jgi:ElaB/YqjD/DUF883 family membrane-anchored ribosome-binding protein